jgi:hypothetical protein
MILFRPANAAKFAALCLALTFAFASRAQTAPEIPYGGHHEFGALTGYSPAGGPIWGFTRNVRYSPTVLRYSYQVKAYRSWTFRYAPELTALSIMRELGPPTDVNPAAPITHYGAGFSPEGFQIVFRPTRKVQPFFSHDGGMIYYADRVLSPQGSQFMFTIDFGAGVNLFTSPRNAVQLGYRYQHLSNANISVHNPGTDADTFYIGFSHFRTKGVR